MRRWESHRPDLPGDRRKANGDHISAIARQISKINKNISLCQPLSSNGCKLFLLPRRWCSGGCRIKMWKWERWNGCLLHCESDSTGIQTVGTPSVHPEIAVCPERTVRDETALALLNYRLTIAKNEGLFESERRFAFHRARNGAYDRPYWHSPRFLISFRSLQTRPKRFAVHTCHFELIMPKDASSLLAAKLLLANC